MKADLQHEEKLRAVDLGRFLVTGPTDVTAKPSPFHCRVCCKEVFVLTHGPHEMLRHFQGSRPFLRDQCLRLETAVWQVLDLEGNTLNSAELQRQREKFMTPPPTVRDGEYFFSEGVNVDKSGAVDQKLAVMARVSARIEVSRLRGNYKLVYQLCSHLTLCAGWVNVDVMVT